MSSPRAFAFAGWLSIALVQGTASAQPYAQPYAQGRATTTTGTTATAQAPTTSTSSPRARSLPIISELPPQAGRGALPIAPHASLATRFVRKDVRLLTDGNSESMARAIAHAAGLNTAENTEMLVRVAERVPALLLGHEFSPREKGATKAALTSNGPFNELLRATKSVELVLDSRHMVQLARALAQRASEPGVREALSRWIETPSVRGGRPGLARSDTERIELALATAALSLAASSDKRAEEALILALERPAVHDIVQNALIAFPPKLRIASINPTLHNVRLYEALGGVGALDLFLTAARSEQAGLRAAGIHASGSSADARIEPIARAALLHSSAEVRFAAAFALVRLRSNDAAAIVASLLRDESVFEAAIALTGELHLRAASAVTALLALHAQNHPSAEVRVAAMTAIGNTGDENSAQKLAAWVHRPELRKSAALALAHSEFTGTYRLLASLALDPEPGVARSGLLAYAVRITTRGLPNGTPQTEVEAAQVIDTYAATCARDSRPARLELAQSCMLVAALRTPRLPILPPLMHSAISGWLLRRSFTGDRTSAASAAFAESSAASALTFPAVFHGPDGPETDEAVVSAALFSNLNARLQPDSAIFSRHSLRRAGSSPGAESAFAARFFARKAEEPDLETIRTWMAGGNAMIRAATAQGLGESSLPQTMGILASLYAEELEPKVRRVSVRAMLWRMARFPAERSAAALAMTLASAEWDPDPETRRLARTARRYHDSGERTGRHSDPNTAALDSLALDDNPGPLTTVWLTLAPTETQTQTQTPAIPPQRQLGTYWDDDGSMSPVIFDSAGDALVGGTSKNGGTLLLTPNFQVALDAP